MVTSFADGSKVSFEQTIVANACGLKVPRRGMLGRDHEGHVDELTTKYDTDMLRELGGIVDYVGAKPNPGIYCLAEHPDPKHRHYLNLYKLGEGPLYSFYTPWHLCHSEVPNTVARVVLFGDVAGIPLGGPLVEVCACAKRDLQTGEVLGRLRHVHDLRRGGELGRDAPRALPAGGPGAGLHAEAGHPKDAVLTYDDVELPPGRLADELRAEQYEHFPEEGASVVSSEPVR
jgi:predicted homoserine dehydrogenase-like protein